ncbi:MAG: PolC-type DNA polymerase III [Firmicutes bacterium]|nr:PolC-type DNA polymerase III [Bacillota bacterium]
MAHVLEENALSSAGGRVDSSATIAVSRLLQQLNIPEDPGLALDGATIAKVVVRRKERIWELHLKSLRQVDPRVVEGLQDRLNEAFGPLVRVVLCIEGMASMPAQPGKPKAWPGDEEAPPETTSQPGTEDGLIDEPEKEYLDRVLKVAQLAQEEEKRARAADTDEVIMGRRIKGDATPLRQLVEEERSAMVAGEIFRLEVKELKSGRRLITFDLTDYTDSITVKIFEEETPREGEGLAVKLSEGLWVKVRGPLQTDRFTQELTLMASDIMKIPPPESRCDEAPEKRVELHLHTKMSAMDSTVEVVEAVKLAARWGHEALAITDHGVVQAFPDAAEVAKKLGVKILYGMEGYLVESVERIPLKKAETDEAAKQNEKEPSYHIILLARNMTGLHNLYKLVSRAHLEYFYRHPLLPREVLSQYREGLIVGSACEAGELFQAMLAGSSDEDLERIAAFYDYLEIQPLCNNRFLIRENRIADEEALKDFNRRLYRLGKRLGKPVAATGDVHFLQPEDAIYRQILLAGQGYGDANQQPGLYLRTTEEMLAEFGYLGEDEAREVVITGPRSIADQVEAVKPIPDELYSPKIEGAEEQIREMTYATAHRIYGEPLPEIVSKRLEKELHSIINNGFAVLYLIAQKLVKKSLDDGYLVGSRGSVGSSLVATMCGITEVNPLPPHYLCLDCHYQQFITDGSASSGVDLPDADCPNCGAKLRKDGHDIPFETFLGFEGDKVPDIDLNFSGEYQNVVHKYTEQLFGKDYVFRAGTIATLADRTAFGFVKKFLEEQGVGARSAEVNRLVGGCSGVKRTTGQHPGGVMVVPRGQEIYNFSPIQYPANDREAGTITTHFDYKSISSRLVKLDILGHDDPTVIRMLQDVTGQDPKEVPLDDPTTMRIFSSVEPLGVAPEQVGSNVGTYGVPEFGTKFVRGILESTRPKTFSDLVRISGFSHGTAVWAGNAEELIKGGTATLAEAISTRDDIMLYLLYRGLPPKTAFKIMEQVRKGKGLKKEDEEVMKAHNVPDWYIDSCKKIQYMFPKAHAVAYVTMAYRIAYFKVRYPGAFYSTYFTVRADEFDADLVIKGLETVNRSMEEIERKGNDATAKEKNLFTILEVVREAMARNVRFLPVDLYESDARKFLLRDDGKALLPPLASLQGLGDAAARTIVEARQKAPFTSVEDLRVRSRLSKTVIEVLRAHGCLKGIPETDQMTLFAF